MVIVLDGFVVPRFDRVPNRYRIIQSFLHNNKKGSLKEKKERKRAKLNAIHIVIGHLAMQENKLDRPVITKM